MNDYFRRNALAGYNVLLASPAFYFLWHLTHNAGFSTSLVRSITGSVRIVPFLTVLYGGCAVTLPMMTGALMARGQKYEEAQSNATAGLMLSGVAMLEALVELRGCGVTFAQMTPSALMCFFPALIGRLAAGVLTQQQKIGKEFQNVLPEEWKTAEGTQAQLYKFFDMLCIDRSSSLYNARQTTTPHTKPLHCMPSMMCTTCRCQFRRAPYSNFTNRDANSQSASTLCGYSCTHHRLFASEEVPPENDDEANNQA